MLSLNSFTNYGVLNRQHAKYYRSVACTGAGIERLNSDTLRMLPNTFTRTIYLVSEVRRLTRDNRVEPGYNDIGLSDTSYLTSNAL